MSLPHTQRNKPHVKLWEVGPRDGLQNETTFVPTVDKLRLIGMLSVAGLSNIEITSCVSPKWVPQMADHAQVIAAVKDLSGNHDFAVLVPNERGMSAAAQAQVGTISVFTAASEEFTRKNINCTIDESLRRFEPVAKTAKDMGKRLRGYVSTAVACPYSGKVAPQAVASVSQQLLDLGCSEISLGDTLGVGKPEDIESLLDAVTQVVPLEFIACHLHDTYGNALANIKASLAYGVRIFDSSVGGLGGCPYAPDAPGNVATESVVQLLSVEGYATGVDTDALASCASWVRNAKEQKWAQE